jgi:hypothetical protein
MPVGVSVAFSRELRRPNSGQSRSRELVLPRAGEARADVGG